LALAGLGVLAGQIMEHEGEVRSAQFSLDGRLVVTASKDYTARVWDATTGQAVGQPMKHEGVVKSAQLVQTGGE
jgi:WD40 repeat protein